MKYMMHFMLFGALGTVPLVITNAIGQQYENPEYSYSYEQYDGAYFDGYSKATNKKYYYQDYYGPGDYYTQDPNNQFQQMGQQMEIEDEVDSMDK